VSTTISPKVKNPNKKAKIRDVKRFQYLLYWEKIKPTGVGQPMFLPANDAVRAMLERHDGQLDDYMAKRQTAIEGGEQPEPLGLGILHHSIPLVCHPDSHYFRNQTVIRMLEEAVLEFLGTQHASGCVSLVNCNIDSPPDTAFTTHIVTQLYEIAVRSGLDEVSKVRDGLRTFLERAKPCLLTGGIHTPNHRWVMAGALANMYAIFKEESFRERAMQFLDEGFDMTPYGEWTERSNAIYNGACAVHLYDVGVHFGYEPAFEAIRKNMTMMQYMLHPDDSLVTEYSGRQDAGQTMMMNDWYYVVLHLMAVHDRSPVFASMAAITDRTAPKGAGALMAWMLQPERMSIPPEIAGEPLGDRYTVLFGEENEVAVPKTIPYRGPIPGHPHGASVLRYRQGKLSVTAMAGQQTLLSIQYGSAKMLGLRLGAGWFGVASVIFPQIRQTGERTYRMELELEGCYFNPLPKELHESAKGMYVKMPNHLREKTHVQYLPLAVEFELQDDGVDVRVVSERIPNIYLQMIAVFDPVGSLSGDGLREEASYLRQLRSGEAVYERSGDCIRITEGAFEHPDAVMRNDKMNRDALNVTVNWRTPADRTLRLRCYTREDGQS
jgi:hypothetical protein